MSHKQMQFQKTLAALLEAIAHDNIENTQHTRDCVTIAEAAAVYAYHAFAGEVMSVEQILHDAANTAAMVAREACERANVILKEHARAGKGLCTREHEVASEAFSVLYDRYRDAIDTADDAWENLRVSRRRGVNS